VCAIVYIKCNSNLPKVPKYDFNGQETRRVILRLLDIASLEPFDLLIQINTKSAKGSLRKLCEGSAELIQNPTVATNVTPDAVSQLLIRMNLVEVCVLLLLLIVK
jgi:hypothetical protein